MSTTPEEFEATLEAFLHKPLRRRLRLAIPVFEELWDNKYAWWKVWSFQQDAYFSAPEDAMRTGLIVGEEEMWFEDSDGKPRLDRWQKPDGTVEVFKVGIPASEPDLRRACSLFSKVCSHITVAVLDTEKLYPGLIGPESALACVCDHENRRRKNGPDWMSKLKGIRFHEAESEYHLHKGGDIAGLRQCPTSVRAALKRVREEKVGRNMWERLLKMDGTLLHGDRAVEQYWPAIKPELIELAAAIERRERDADDGSAMVDDEARLSPAELAERFSVSQDALRQRLDEWRKKNHEGWYEVTDRKPREAKYMYRVASVRHIIEQMHVTSQSTSE